MFEKDRVQDDSRHQIEPARHSDELRHQGDEGQTDRVEEDVTARVLGAVRHRQHRKTGCFVLLGAVQGQRPEMWRRPHKDDEEEQPGLGRHGVGDGSPTQHRRHGAGGAADDDVLRGVGLEEDGVDDGVTDEGRQRQPHGQRIDLVQHRKADTAEHAGNH